MNHPASPRLGRIWIAAALLALLAGANALRNGLVYDGDALVRQNATLEKAAEADTLVGRVGGLVRVFGEGFWDGVNRKVDPTRRILGQALYRPLFLFSLGLVRIACGDTPWPFHLLNVLLHALATVLVLRLAFLLTRSRRISWIAAVLFALHPVHAEAVAYVAGLGETQSTALGLLAAVLYLGGATREGASPLRLLFAVVAFAAALLTKESAATILPLLVLADFARRDAPRPAVRLAFYGALLLVVAGDIYVRYRLFGRIAPDTTLISRLDNPLVQEGFLVRLATGVTLYARALQLLLLPIGLSADYSFNQLPVARSLLEPAALSAFLLCAALTLLALLSLRRAVALGFGLFVFLFAFGAVSNIPVPIGTIFADRLLYLPSVGFALAAAHLLAALLDALQRKGEASARVLRGIVTAAALIFGTGVFLVAVAAASDIPGVAERVTLERTLYVVSFGVAVVAAHFVFSILNKLKWDAEVLLRVARGVLVAAAFGLLVAHWLRNTKYRDAETLYADMVKTAPDSARAWYQRGEMERQRALNGEREALNAASFDFRHALEILPQFLLARLQLASVLAELGKYDEAMRMLKESEKMVPDQKAFQAVHDDIKRRLALVLSRATATPDPAERQKAVNELVSMMEGYLRDHPEDPSAATELGVIYLKVGRLEDARDLVERERRAHPDDEALKALEIQVVFQSGDLERGAKLLDAFESAGPAKNPDAQKVVELYRGLLHLQRAMAARESGDEEKALGEFEEAARRFDRYVQLHPDDDQGYYWRGFTLHEGFSDRYDQALKDYQRAVKMNPANQDAFFRLAQLLVAKGEVNAVTLRYFQELSKLHKDNGFFFVGYGNVASRLGRWEEAAKAFKRAIELGFNGANVHAGLAMALIEQGKAQEALDHLKRAEKEFELRDPQIENLKGACLLELERPEPALHRFELGLELVRRDTTGRFAGLDLQLRLQAAKTKLRIDGRQSEGLRELVDLGDELSARLSGGDALSRPAKETLVYSLVQRAWARRHVEKMKDLEAALALLTRARSLCEDLGLERPLPDVLEALAETLDEAGRGDEAEAVRGDLEKLRKRAEIKIVEKRLPAGAGG